MIHVAVSGTGEMGRTVLATVEAQDDMECVGILEPMADPGDHSAASGAVYAMHADPAELFAFAHPDVVVDFTNAAAAARLVEAALEAGVRPVIGTTGVEQETVDALRAGCAERKLGGVIASNFAIGAVVLMHVAEIASRFFDSAEIIELHHDGKVDAPSGTARETALRMRAARGSDFDRPPDPELVRVEGTRGGVEGGVGIHSVRLPGFVAHQEVIFGGLGQTLTFRHDSTGRDSFMPGVLLAIREVMQRDTLVEGLDTLVGLA